MGEIYPEEEPKNFNYKEPRKGALSILDKYGTNINKLAAEGRLDPVIGREDEIFRTIQILGRRRKNNPILVGHPGVGKTAIIEGLALKIINNDVPASLQGKIIYTIEISTIVAGTKYRGEFEERMKAIVDELVSNSNIIIFIDEIHTLIGAGGTSGSLDASNIIKPVLARGEIRCIGATTFDEYRESIEGDGALDRRFQKVIIEPTTLEQTKEIILNAKRKYESHHNVTYSKEIVDLIVKMADTYIYDRYFPDKAIDIMDEVGSFKNLIGVKVPKKIKQLEEKLIKLEKEKLNAVHLQDYELAAKKRDSCTLTKSQIKLEYSLWESSTAKNKIPITEEDVLKVISKATGIPVEKITDKENKNLLGINEYLSSKVIGQEEAINKIAVTIQRNRIGIRKKNRTIGNFIFLGSTGTGKTFLTKKVAEYLFNSENNLIRVDMSEYMEAHSVSKLIGAPPGYVGHESGGFLTEQVKRKPHSVILFDEVEKAHPDIFNVLLQLLDDGHLTDSLGRQISFRNCLIILTSNTGARQISEFGTGVGFKSGNTMAVRENAEREIVMKELNRKFSPEFLNRIDEIVIFNKLSKENIMTILNNECKELSNNLFDVGKYKFKITKSAKELILKQGYDEKFGARPLRRTLERLVENPISEMILKGELQEANTIKVSTINNSIKITKE